MKGGSWGRPFCVSSQSGIAAPADPRMRMGADIGQDFPAAFAFVTRRMRKDHGDIGYVI